MVGVYKPSFEGIDLLMREFDADQNEYIDRAEFERKHQEAVREAEEIRARLEHARLEGARLRALAETSPPATAEVHNRDEDASDGEDA